MKYTTIRQIEKVFRIEKKLTLDSNEAQIEIAKKNLGNLPVTLIFKNENNEICCEKFQANDFEMQHICKVPNAVSSKLYDCSEYLRAVNLASYGAEYAEGLITYLKGKINDLKRRYIEKFNTHNYVGSQTLIEEERDKKLMQLENEIEIWTKIKEQGTSAQQEDEKITEE